MYIVEVREDLDVRDARRFESFRAFRCAQIGNVVRVVIDVSVIGGKIVGPAIHYDTSGTAGEGGIHHRDSSFNGP
ncbi:hypothetical protein QF000_000820 [Paraburkholderia atlantica]|uniref:hypothetical protein n=1 Tax=Paraburkholderia atlantica TaxID=2654982 RepID=UPI0017E69A74|nr:hypothetical protein [Paraburkholderia atlantica]MBB5421477.1 hypothetical protein [Paraburkholderia atlantica]